MEGRHTFGKQKKIYKSCGLAQLISICTADVLRQDLTGRNKGTCHTNSDNLSSFPWLGNSREELRVFRGLVLSALRNTRSVLLFFFFFLFSFFSVGLISVNPYSILCSGDFHSESNVMSDSSNVRKSSRKSEPPSPEISKNWAKCKCVKM